MNFARPAGVIPARPLSFQSSFSRSGVFACAGVLAALNAQADVIINALTYEPVLTGVANLGGVSAVMWVAMYVALKLGCDDESPALTRTDAMVVAAVVTLSFLPVSYAAQVGLLLCAIYLLLNSDSGSASRGVSILLLALTGPLLWGRILLHVLALPLLSLDAHLVALTIGTKVEGNTVQFAGSATPFLIAGPCSSLHNMSLAVVLWSTAGVLFRVRLDARFTAWGLAMAAWMFLVNVARLAAIGCYPADFHFLHEGLGADMFGWAGLLGAGALAAMGVSSAVVRQR